MTSVEQSIKQDKVSRIISDRLFGVILCCILLIFSVGPTLLGAHSGHACLWVGIAIGLIAMLCPLILKWPKTIWFLITHQIANVVNFALLAIVFFGIISPVGIFFRMTRRDVMRRKRDRRCPSYWIDRAQCETHSPSMKNQY